MIGGFLGLCVSGLRNMFYHCLTRFLAAATSNLMYLPFWVGFLKITETKDIKESFILKIGHTVLQFFYKNSQSKNFLMSVIPADRLFIIWKTKSSLPAKLRQRWWDLNILASLQLLFTIHEVVDSIDDYLNKLNLW